MLQRKQKFSYDFQTFHSSQSRNNIFLTYHDEINPDFHVAESIDTFANVDPSVVHLGLLDPQLFSFGPDSDPGVVNRFAAFFPLNYRGGISRDRALNFNVLSQPDDGF